MKNKINNILIGLLWLLAATLGICFWFNTMFGFNIFSLQHWQYIAYMQATGQPVKPLFYISIVIAALLTLFVLYRLLQPQFRQINLPIVDCAPLPPVSTTSKSIKKDTETVPTTNPTPEPNISEQPKVTTSSNVARPPRLNIPTITRTEHIPHVPLTSSSQPPTNPETEYADIRAIFETAGYVFKGMPKIKGVQTAVVAIGMNEVLWIGAVGVKNTDMHRAIQTLSNVFSDTLDDIEIHINSFIIAAPDASDATNDILQFATVDDLRKYVAGIPNTPPNDDESENFDAYSGYIGTVIDYIGKI